MGISWTNNAPKEDRDSGQREKRDKSAARASVGNATSLVLQNGHTGKQWERRLKLNLSAEDWEWMKGQVNSNNNKRMTSNRQ